MRRRALGGVLGVLGLTCALVQGVAPRAAEAHHFQLKEYAAAPAIVPADAEWDSVSGFVVMTTRASESTEPASLVAFDPSDGEVAFVVSIGGDPTRLEIAPDGSRAYVQHLDSARLTEVDLVARTVTADHDADPGVGGTVVIHDIAVLPEDPSSVLIAYRRFGPFGLGVGLMTNGELADMVTPVGPSELELAVTGPGNAVGLASNDRQLYRITYDDAGVLLDSEPFVDGFGTGYDVRDIDLVGDELVLSSGVVIDPDSGAELATYGDERVSSAGVAYDDDRIYLVSRFDTAIRIYDRTTRAEVDAVPLPDRSINGHIATPSGPLAWTHTRGFVEQVGPPMAEVKGTVGIEFGDSGYEYRGPPFELCVDVWDADTQELILTVETYSFGDYELLFESGPRIKLLFWDCFGVGLFPAWHGGAVLADWAGATTIDMHRGGFVRVNIDLDPVFVDIDFGRYYTSGVFALRNAGVTTGCRALHYCPDDPVTREQMASFMARSWRLFGGVCSPTGSPFDDVSTTSFAFFDVACIAELGVTNGTGPTTYSPAQPVTREQMASFIARLWRAFGFECPPGGHPFHDVDSSSFAFFDIACIFNLDITTGTSATTYAPGDPVTRAQMAAFLERFFEAVAERS